MTNDSMFTPEHERHDDLFKKAALDNEDDLGAVIRAQVFIEYYLAACIRSALYDRGAVSNATFNSLRFDTRVELAIGLGIQLEPKLIDAMKNLASVRNRLAHRLGTELEESTANDFLGRLPERLNTYISRLRQDGDTWREDFRTGLFVLVVDVRIAATELIAHWQWVWNRERDRFTDPLGVTNLDIPLAMIEDNEPPE